MMEYTIGQYEAWYNIICYSPFWFCVYDIMWKWESVAINSMGIGILYNCPNCQDCTPRGFMLYHMHVQTTGTTNVTTLTWWRERISSSVKDHFVFHRIVRSLPNHLAINIRHRWDRSSLMPNGDSLVNVVFWHKWEGAIWTRNIYLYSIIQLTISVNFLLLLLKSSA